MNIGMIILILDWSNILEQYLVILTNNCETDFLILSFSWKINLVSLIKCFKIISDICNLWVLLIQAWNINKALFLESISSFVIFSLIYFNINSNTDTGITCTILWSKNELALLIVQPSWSSSSVSLFMNTIIASIRGWWNWVR